MNNYYQCETPYCHAYKGRCYLCGGIFVECRCHSSDYDNCICGSHAETFKEIRLKHFFIFIKNFCYELYVLIRYRDNWWFRYGMWGKDG